VHQLSREEDAHVGGGRDREVDGKTAAGFQQFGAALHAGSNAGPGARDALVALIDDQTQPAIARASAIDRLANLLSRSTPTPWCTH
jgi:hypothetical protein